MTEAEIDDLAQKMVEKTMPTQEKINTLGKFLESGIAGLMEAGKSRAIAPVVAVLCYDFEKDQEECRLHMIDTGFNTPMEKKLSMKAIAVSGMNVDLRVKYTSLNVKLGNFIKHGKFLLSTTEELTKIEKHTFVYFQTKTKTKKELTRNELFTIVRQDLSHCPACVHGVLPFHIVGRNGSSALTNLFNSGLSAESVSDNLLKDMRFKPERKHSKKGNQ